MWNAITLVWIWTLFAVSISYGDDRYTTDTFQSPYQVFGDRSKCTSYTWYHRHLQVLYSFFLVFWPNICFPLRVFFTSDLSLDFEWQLIFSGLQESPEYFSRSQQCRSLNGFDSPTDLQFFQFLLQASEERSEPTIFNSLARFECLSIIFLFFFFFFFFFSVCVPLERQNPQDGKLFFYYSLIRAFHISVSRWFFAVVWVTASLLKSPGLFLVFWPFSIMLSFGWSPPVRQLPSPPVPLVIPKLLFQTHQFQLV